MNRTGKHRVAVVGAGAAGLCAARHILFRAELFDPPVVFEQNERMGGMWYYKERVGTSDDGRMIHSSMYRDLRTNLPKEVMMLSDFLFDSNLPSFLTHWDVQQYLEAYCKRHDIMPHIKVILSHNKPSLPFSLPLEIKQAPPVVKVLDDGSLFFQDGSVVHAQVLLLCTGYNYHFPFLCLKQLGLEVQHHLVAPLYKYLVLPSFPSLFFIGVCKNICPFLHFHYQVQFAIAVIDGTVLLPSRELMEENAKRERQRKIQMGVQVKHLLQMDSEQWDYYKNLATAAKLSPPNPVIQCFYEEVGRQRRANPQTYREINYRLVNATEWQLFNAPSVQTDNI